jgi:4-amino-4-deoxychorismate lyase
MSQLFDVIKVHNRQLLDINYHNNRVNQSLSAIFGIKNQIHLEKLINIPDHIDNQTYKCRIIYSNKIEKIQFEPYAHKIIKSLKIATCNDIDYGYKYFDRSKINELFERREDRDDILIIKNGFVTDSSYANIVFWDGTKWITPSTPLLPGTKRQQLVDEKRIFEKEIKKNDLHSFEKARIINAMIDLEESNNILINNILF